MIFTALTKDQVRNGWPWISAVLEPAIRQNASVTMQRVYSDLVDGPDLVMVPHGWAEGVIVFEVTPDAICWVKYVAGSIIGGPKARLAKMREAALRIEQVAASAGCKEVRLCGRDWGSILTGYELISEWPNGLRKVLTPMSDNAKEAA